MKMKFMLCAIAGALCLMAPASLQAAQTPATERIYASADGFNQMKAILNATIESLKVAKNGDEVAKAMYNYVKEALPVMKDYSEMTEYQQKQIDTLQKQVGILSQKKTAQFNCKKEVDAAVQKATLEMISTMK